MAETIERAPIPEDKRLLVKAAAAADLLSVPVETLERLPIARRKIPGVKGVRYRMSDLIAFAEER